MVFSVIVAASVVSEENVVSYRRVLGGEDFGFMTRKKPCVFFRMGIRTGQGTGYSAHSDQFDVDEGCLVISSEIFTRFVLENQDGIEGLPDHVGSPSVEGQLVVKKIRLKTKRNGAYYESVSVGN